MKKLEEEFKDIIGYEDYYLIGNKGTVVAKNRFVTDKNGVTYNYKGGILTPNKTKKGYLMVGLSKKCKSKGMSVHRLVAKHFVGGYKENLQVNHKDGDKLNNHYSNLEWVTCKENIGHSWKNGLHDMNKKRKKVVY